MQKEGVVKSGRGEMGERGFMVKIQGTHAALATRARTQQDDVSGPIFSVVGE